MLVLALIVISRPNAVALLEGSAVSMTIKVVVEGALPQRLPLVCNVIQAFRSVKPRPDLVPGSSLQFIASL